MTNHPLAHHGASSLLAPLRRCHLWPMSWLFSDRYVLKMCEAKDRQELVSGHNLLFHIVGINEKGPVGSIPNLLAPGDSCWRGTGVGKLWTEAQTSP